MKTKWLINPFERIAGWQALAIGLVVIALTAVIGKLNHIAFDGALDVHTGATFSFSTAFIMQAVNFLVLFIFMWLAGICFSKTKVRAVDVAGTIALARTPMLLLSIICFLPVAPASLYDIPRLPIFIIISIILIIWMIALMYNGFSVSCHLKGSRGIISFIGALLLAEIVSKVIYIFLLSSIFTNAPTMSTSGEDITEKVVAATDSLTIRQKAEIIVAAFEQGDFDTITTYFDETMRKALPPSGLKIAWVQSNMMFGTFENADLKNIKEIPNDQYDLLLIPLTFKKEKRNLQLAFNKKGQVSGLYIK